MKKWSVALVALALLIGLTAQVWAARPIKLIVNGVVTATDVAPQIIKGRVMVPVRWVAQALGANVAWEEETQSVKIEKQESTSLERRLELLERAVAAQTPDQAVETWAKGVKTRNGALQFAMFSPELTLGSSIYVQKSGSLYGPPYGVPALQPGPPHTSPSSSLLRSPLNQNYRPPAKP